MARKRTPIKGLGADAYFTDPPPAEDVQNSPNPETDNLSASQQDSRTSRQYAGKTARQQDSKTVNQQLVKATFYLEPDHITTLEELKLQHRKRTGKNIDKSELVRKAIELLARQ